MKHNNYTSTCNKCGGKGWFAEETPCTRNVKRYLPCGHWNGEYKKCKGTNVLIDYSGLDTRFIYPYENDYRVEVTYKWGDIERGWLGKSTGWRPIWLLVKKTNSCGGEALIQDSIVDIKYLYKRV